MIIKMHSIYKDMSNPSQLVTIPRKIVRIWIVSAVLLLIIFLLISVIPSTVYAESTVSLSGPSVIRAGDTLKISYSITGENVLGALGTIQFNPDQLSFSKTDEILAGWESTAFNTSGGSIVFVGAGSNAPISGTQKLFSVTFVVRTSIPSGETIVVDGTDLSTSDGMSDYEPSEVSYSIEVSPTKSTNNNLNSLTVGNAQISPTFSPSVTTYSTTVSYSVSKLNLSATAQDAHASISLSNPNLSVGTTAVRIVVTAESGATKTYTINVTRQQDPQYQPSGNANLKSLVPASGILSPDFDPAKTDYIVYLPDEFSEFSAKGTASDAKARNIEAPTIDLEPGQNQYSIVVTAENGTTKTYRITVMRMPAFGENASSMTTSDNNSSLGNSFANSNGLSNTGNGGSLESGVPKVGVILLALWTFIVGGVIAFLITKKKYTE